MKPDDAPAQAATSWCAQAVATPCVMPLEDGYTYIRMPLPSACGTDYCMLGVRTKSGRVRSVRCAVPGAYAVTLAEYQIEGAYNPALYANEDITPSAAEIGAAAKTITVAPGGAPVAVTGVALNKSALTLTVGASETLAATVITGL